ncbi:hypothetical protein KIW84_066565 [Lathyrus oleraceus]|uniref:Kinesin motor domain-containing protein n=1 Tax=Pisum sativum TaxID=3888 RepID=A0A9D5A8S2_PEA|nr:hypothetical protein KIW84_066565 [Pisum sativum]
MDFPQICCYFSVVAWCGKVNAIAYASEAGISDPSSILSPSFWIHVHIVIPERPTECAVFNVISDSPPIWTHPSQEPAKFVLVTSYWQCEHEWRKNISVATEWLSAVSPYRWISSKSGVLANSKSVFEKNFTSPTIDTSAPTTVSSSCNTMHGTVENPGVTVFAIKVLFSKIRTRSYDGHHVVHLSYLEVYNETVRDLISPGRPLVLRAAGLTQYRVYSADKVMALLQQGNRNRTTEPSSRIVF